MANVVLDFYCHEKRLVVELGGGIHEGLDKPSTNAWRTQALGRLGCRVVRFRNKEALNEFKRVLAKLRQWVAESLKVVWVSRAAQPLTAAADRPRPLSPWERRAIH